MDYCDSWSPSELLTSTQQYVVVQEDFDQDLDLVLSQTYRQAHSLSGLRQRASLFVPGEDEIGSHQLDTCNDVVAVDLPCSQSPQHTNGAGISATCTSDKVGV